MIDAMAYVLLLLTIGFLCGGAIALFASPKAELTDAQYREIRENMKGVR